VPSHSFRTWPPVEPMAFSAAPGTQIDVQSGCRPRDADLPVGSRLPQGAFDQEISAFGESERSEVYLHRARES
jgi:hypothetical protein